MEKINQIEINNFKSIKQLKIGGFKKINIFIGYPNAGKSNLLEALSLFGAVDYGKYNIEEIIRFNNVKELFFEENVLRDINVNLNKSKLTLGLRSELRSPEKTYELNKDLDFYFKSSDRISSSLKYFIRKYHFKDNYNKIVSDRKYFNFGLNSPYGENLSELLSYDSNLRRTVTDFFKKNNLKILLDKGTNELKVFREYQDGTVFTLPYNLIADTLQRLVFFKVAILSNNDSVLLFEEPEAHCFEPYILEFTNNIKYDKNNNQFFIVTHSDFIIQEFLRDEESRNNTSIYLVNSIEAETSVKQLRKENNEDVYELGMNPFFNFENLWDAN